MRVIFMGTPDFSVETLNALIAAGHEIVCVVTQPDRMKGRGKTVQFPPVKEAAIKHGINVYQPEKVRSSEFMENLKGIEADIIVVVAFGQILPKEILEMYPYGCVNVHASLLPAYRGAAPYQWAILNGEKVTGVTTQQMNEGIDTGDIIEKVKVEIETDETAGSLHDKLSRAGAGLCVSTLTAIEAGTATFTPQKDEESSYAKMLKKDMGNIDWTKSAEEIERFIRGLNPWPSAYTKLNGKTLKIWKAKVLKEDTENTAAGEFASYDKKNWVIQTGKGCLALLEVQLEGKKRMNVEEFLRGYSLDKEENKCFYTE